MKHVEDQIRARFESQHGLITFGQAIDAGLAPGAIAWLVRVGRWQLVGRRTYRLSGSPQGWRQTALAGCLASPSGAVVSNMTAAALHGLIPTAPALLHVTVPFGASTRNPNAVVHRARMHPLDVTSVDGLAATSVARTLVDLAAGLPPVRLKRLVDTAMHRSPGLTSQGVETAWDRSQRGPGRHGHGALMTALEDWQPEIRPGSPAEARLIRLLRQWGFPEPERQIPVLDDHGVVIARIDVGWGAPKIGIEYDSEEFHAESRWAADERRHSQVEARDWILVHADKADLRPGVRTLQQAVDRAWAARGRHVA